MADHRSADDVRRGLFGVAAAWVRIEPRLRRDFDEAFSAAREAANVTAAWDDAAFHDVGGAEPVYLPHADKLAFVADELYEFADTAGAIAVLVIDRQLRHVYKAVDLTYATHPAGPLVGQPANKRPTEAFTEVVRAGANSFRHTYQWLDLAFNPRTGEYEQGTATVQEYKRAMQSIQILQRALVSYDPRFPHLLEVLRVLAMNSKNDEPDYDIFRERFLSSVREVVCAAGYGDHYVHETPF
jgi:hypothetical protein